MMFWIYVLRVLVLLAIVGVGIYFVYKEIIMKEGNVFIDIDFSPYREYLKNLKNSYKKEHCIKK
jgi:hypothetical protein